MSPAGRWSHRLCERCWFRGPGYGDGVYLRLPVQVRTDGGGVGQCCGCGSPVVTSIYTRADPADSSLLCGGKHDGYDDDDTQPLPRLGEHL